MKLKMFLKETMDLDTTFKHPATLWLQGLNAKEYNKLIKILSLRYNGNTTKKKLEKAFPSLTEELLNEFEKLYKATILSSLKKEEEEYVSEMKSNFGGLMFRLGTINPIVIIKRIFNKIR